MVMHYPFIVPLQALADWSVFLEQVSPTMFTTEIIGPMERALHGGHGSEIHPSGSESSLILSECVWALAGTFWTHS